jgi:hypothetical protein
MQPRSSLIRGITPKGDFESVKMHAYIEGQRAPHLEELSPAMWNLLFETARLGSAPYFSGGLSTRRALRDQGLLTVKAPTTLTEKGRRALIVEWRDPKTGEVHHRPEKP